MLFLRCKCCTSILLLFLISSKHAPRQNHKSGHDCMLSHYLQFTFHCNHPVIRLPTVWANCSAVWATSTQTQQHICVCPSLLRAKSQRAVTSLIYPLHLLINQVALLQYALWTSVDDDCDDNCDDLVNWYFFHQKFLSVPHPSQRVIPFTLKTLLGFHYHYTKCGEN